MLCAARRADRPDRRSLVGGVGRRARCTRARGRGVERVGAARAVRGVLELELGVRRSRRRRSHRTTAGRPGRARRRCGRGTRASAAAAPSTPARAARRVRPAPRPPHRLALVGGRGRPRPARTSSGTSSTGMHDAPRPSARSGSTARRTRSRRGRSTGCAASAACASPPRRRARARENFMVVASDYEQPFGTLRRRAARSPARSRGLGRHGAPRGALVSERSPSSRSPRRSPPRWCATARAPEALVALGGAAVLLRRRRDRLGRRGDEAQALGPTLVVLAALLVLGDGCERAGLFDALAARMAVGARAARRSGCSRSCSRPPPR